MERVNFLYTEIKVYPASVEEDGIGYKWETLLIAEEPVLATYENLGIPFDKRTLSRNDLYQAIENWVKEETLNKGKELIYQNCPTEPEFENHSAEDAEEDWKRDQAQSSKERNG